MQGRPSDYLERSLTSRSLQDSDDEMAQSFASSSLSREDGFDSRFWVRDNQCKLCNRKFSKLKGLARHHCRFCGVSVCDSHSTKRRDHPELNKLVRICDLCEKNIVGHNLKQELQLEVSKREAQLDGLQEEIKRREGEKTDKEKQIARIRLRVEEDAKAATLKENKLTESLMEQQSRNQRQQGIIDNLSGALHEVSESEKITSEKLARSSAALDSLKTDLEHMQKDIKELDDSVDGSFFKMRYRIPTQVVSKVFCEACQNRSFHTSFKESIMQADTASSQPSDPGKCYLM